MRSSWLVAVAASASLASVSREANGQPADPPAAEAAGDAADEPEDDQPSVLTGDDLVGAARPPQAPLAPVRQGVPYGTGPTATPPLATPLAPAGAPGATSAAAAAAAADPGIEPASLSDAASGNNFFMPTALMPPAGSFGLHDYELFVAGMSYAPTNYLVFSLSGLLPIDDELRIGAATAKVQIYRGETWRLALHGGVLFGSDGGDGDGVAAGSAGLAATACLDAECTSHFSAFAALAAVDEDESTTPLFFASGLVLRVAENARILAELDMGSSTSDSDLDEEALLWYGLRFTSRKLSTDVGFVRPIADYDTDSFPLGLPMVIFNYRS